MSVPREIIAPRHVERFQCTGGACEDTCCQRWTIHIDRDHARRFLKVLDSPAERDRFRDAIVVRQDWATNPQQYAAIKLREDGFCPYLDAERLCEVERRHGAGALWDTCVTYPRLYSRSGDRLEVWASLSCPEMARQLLLHDDAVDLVAVDPSRASRTVLQHDLPAEPARPYDRFLDDIRVTVLRVLAAPGMSLRERLYLLMLFGERTAAFFHRDAAAVDVRLLGDELTLAAHPDVHATVRAAFAELPDECAPVVRLLLGLVGNELQKRLVMSLTGLVKDVLRPAAVPGEAAAGDRMTIDVPTLSARYDDRRTEWEAAHGDRIERAFTNYARAYWMREWYTDSPNLAVHGRRLLLRIALMRLLVYCHPKLDGIEPNDAGAGEALAAAAVDVCYRLARGIDHDLQLVEPLDRALASGDVERLEKQLLRF